MQTITHEFAIALIIRTQGYMYTCTALVCHVVFGSGYSTFHIIVLLLNCLFDVAHHLTEIFDTVVGLAGVKNLFQLGLFFENLGFLLRLSSKWPLLVYILYILRHLPLQPKAHTYLHPPQLFRRVL